MGCIFLIILYFQSVVFQKSVIYDTDCDVVFSCGFNHSTPAIVDIYYLQGNSTIYQPLYECGSSSCKQIDDCTNFVFETNSTQPSNKTFFFIYFIFVFIFSKL